MMKGVAGISDATVLALANALEAGRIGTEDVIEPISLRSVSGAAQAAAELERLRAKGVGSEGLAAICRLVVAERERTRSECPKVSLVWTGPDAAAETETMDTGVVMRRLFERATRSVLVSSYSLGSGKALFYPLAKRMQEVPGLDVTMVFDITLAYNQTGLTVDGVQLETAFLKKFFGEQWPAGAKEPKLFWDPRTRHKSQNISFHAKCVVVDEEVALVTSANTSYAAQSANIEAGVLVERSTLAKDLAEQFRKLIDTGVLDRIDGVFR